MRRLVVKVGTSSLTHGNGKLNVSRMERIVRQIADVRNLGLEVILVTSGAIACGMGRLGLHERPSAVSEKQALAAIGQGILMQMYEKLFAEYGYIVGQVLLTRDDISSEERSDNIRNTLNTLIRYGAIPIVNENDTVAVEEIRFGDNDTLSAFVAVIAGAQLLILLSDVDGLFTADPHRDARARLIPVVEEIGTDLGSHAGGSCSLVGTGGMVTKIEAARIATSHGIYVTIANSERDYVIRDLLEGKPCGTLFLPCGSAVSS